MPDPLEELKNRILGLENHKAQLEDISAWRLNEFPKYQKEIGELNQALHELREEFKKLVAPAPAPGPTAPDDSALMGHFGL